MNGITIEYKKEFKEIDIEYILIGDNVFEDLVKHFTLYWNIIKGDIKIKLLIGLGNQDDYNKTYIHPMLVKKQDKNIVIDGRLIIDGNPVELKVNESLVDVSLNKFTVNKIDNKYNTQVELDVNVKGYKYIAKDKSINSLTNINNWNKIT